MNHNPVFREKLIEDYWLAKLAAFAPQRPAHPEAPGRQATGRITAHLPAASLAGLETLAKGNAWGKYTLGLAVYAFLVNYYFGEKAFLVGTGGDPEAASGEPAPLLFGVRVDPARTLRELVLSLREEVGETLNHQDWQRAGMADLLAARGVEAEGLAEYAFSYDRVGPAGGKTPAAGFHLAVAESEGGWELTLTHAGRRLPAAPARQWLDHYCRLLAALPENLARPLGAVAVLSETECEHLLSFNTHRAPLTDHSIVTAFERCAAAFPGCSALTCGPRTYTYGELNAKANQLARSFRAEYGVGLASRVGLMLERTEWIVIGMLAVLKAGGAFVPVDPAAPPERNAYILGNAAVDLLLIESENLFPMEGYTGAAFAVDLQGDQLTGEATNLPLEYRDDDLAYVIYTSGTTGAPKGVMIEHHSVANYAAWVRAELDLSEQDSTVLLTSYAFDLGYTGLFGTLLTGGHLHIYAPEVPKAPGQLLDYLAAQGITFIKTTPSLFHLLTAIPHFRQVAPGLALRLVVLGGEPIRVDDVEAYRQLNGRTRFVNHYGPTETTIGTTICHLDPPRLDACRDCNVIGRPALNNQVLILNENLRLLPAGVPGELCIGGEGVARGYLDNPQLTGEKFVDHPYQPGKRLYRSGDYGHLLPDGSIALAGRKDGQVKVRGYRVELAEIEQVLRRQPRVEDAKVLAGRKEGVARLTAYVKTSGPATGQSLKEALARALPDYMIPAAFVITGHFPLTPNGKTDLAALARLQPEAEAEREYTAPATETEQQLAAIWREVLGLERIGVRNNFFDLGANSLLLVEANVRINQYHPQVSITDLFAYPNVGELASYIAGQAEATRPALTPDAIAFPADFFSAPAAGRQSHYDYVFRVEEPYHSQVLRAAAAHGVDVYTVTAALFFYSLSEMSGQEVITVQVGLSAEDRVVNVQIPVGQVQNVDELYQRVAGGIRDRTDQPSYSLKATDRVNWGGRRETDIVPFMLNGVLPADSRMLEPYDLCLGLREAEGEKMEFFFRYKAARLDPQKMEQFIHHYISVLQSV